MGEKEEGREGGREGGRGEGACTCQGRRSKKIRDRPDSEPGHCNLNVLGGHFFISFPMVVETAHAYNTPGKVSFRRAMRGH